MLKYDCIDKCMSLAVSLDVQQKCETHAFISNWSVFPKYTKQALAKNMRLCHEFLIAVRLSCYSSNSFLT